MKLMAFLFPQKKIGDIRFFHALEKSLKVVDDHSAFEFQNKQYKEKEFILQVDIRFAKYIIMAV